MNSWRMQRLLGVYGALLGLFGAVATIAQTPTRPSSQPAGLTVAVLTFAGGSGTTGHELGAQVAELVTISLSGQPGIVLVERAALDKVLEEQALNLTGLVETEQAVKVGRLVGARVLVTGKVFAVGSQTFMTAKLIGTETTRVEGVLVKDDGQTDIPTLALSLGKKVAESLATVGPQLVAQDGAGVDPLPRLKTALRDRKTPVVAIIIPERHVTVAPPVPDPAVETEMKKLLIECGFRMQDVKQNELADFARRLPELSPEGWPRALTGADVVIVGEALSENGTRIGNLATCTARAEINVIDRASGKIVLAERTTQRAADLSENVAAKEALAKAGRVLALAVLEHFASASNALSTTTSAPSTAVRQPTAAVPAAP